MLRARGAQISPGGGMRTIIEAVFSYNSGRDWSPKGIIFVDGRADNGALWTIRPVLCEWLRGALAFRHTTGGGQLVAFRDIDGHYNPVNALVTLDPSEATVVNMNGAAVLDWAYDPISRVTKPIKRAVATHSA